MCKSAETSAWDVCLGVRMLGKLSRGPGRRGIIVAVVLACKSSWAIVEAGVLDYRPALLIRQCKVLGGASSSNNCAKPSSLVECRWLQL